MRISCPPTRHPCFFGIDFPSRAELIAADHTVEEVCKFIGADTLGYLSHEGLLSAVDHPNDFCTGCFTGKYPVAVTEEMNKLDLEVGAATG